MKEFIEKLSKERWLVFSVLFLVIGLVVGDTGMLLAEMTPVDPGKTASPDQTGRDTVMNGKTGSVTNLEHAGAASEIILEDLDTEISKFRPEYFPLDTIVRRAAVKRMRSNYEVKHYSLGSARKKAEVTADYTENTSAKKAVISLASDDAGIFNQYSTINVKGLPGYDANGNETPGIDLMLYVVGTDSTTGMPIVRAINGKKTAATDAETYVPTIPAGTKLFLMQNAGSESQLFVPPMNFSPVPETIYMQRQILNTKFTRYFKNVKREVPYDEQDIDEQALYEFRSDSEATYLFGVKNKIVFNDPNYPNRGPENVYFMKGLWWYITKFFEYTPGAFTYNDLLGITKRMFVGNNGSRQAFFGVGSDLAEDIHKIDYSIYKDLSISSKEKWGIKMTSFESIFGTLNLIRLPKLDEMDRADQGVVIDLDRFVRYVMRDTESKKVDLSVVGEEAERNIKTIIDAPALKGDSHMIVRPA